jgi:hypothetical protein
MEEAKEYYDNSKDTLKILVSPKLFLFDDIDEKDDKKNLKELIKDLESEFYIKDKIIKVKKKDGKYLVLENIDFAKAALYAGVSYIQIELIV